MNENIEFNNPNANKLMDFFLSKIRREKDKDSQISVNDEGGFYKLFFWHKTNTKCPFSLWISTGNGDNIFFNIGNVEQEATVFHYFDITIDLAVEEIIDFFDSFWCSFVHETKIYCRNKLKRINYDIRGNRVFPKFSYLQESYLTCFNKRKEVKLYQPWH